MAYSVQRDMSYVKACKIKRLRIEKAEENVAETGLDYLKQVRFATFISMTYGYDSKQSQLARKELEKKLERYMKALEFCYNSIHLDIKELMDNEK